MKKYLLSILASISFFYGQSQTIRASIGSGTTLNDIKIYLKPDITNPSVAISSLNFNVALPSSITPIPTLTVQNNSIAGVSWVIDAPYIENGYIHYNIGNAQSGYTLNCNANVEFEALELRFGGGPVGTFTNTAHLVTLPDGGGGNNLALFYCTSAIGGLLNSNGQSLYYARDANVVIANGDSYTPQQVPGQHTPLGTFTSYARLTTGIVIPVKFNAFTAVKKDDNGLLNWSVENESATTDRYEVERSLDGISFTKAYTVAPKNNGLSSNIYALTDFNLSLIKRSGVIYYRIKQVDKDFNFIYSEIRSVRLGAKGNDISIYPNPVKTTTVVNIDLVNAEKVSIVMYDVTGKEMQRSELQGNKGLNRYRLDMSNLPSGTYQVRVNTGAETTTLPVVKVN